MSEFYGEPDIIVSNNANHISEGINVPDVVFKTRTRVDSDDENPFVWKDTTTDDYFKGKKCILFALPGAFTPTCSSSHLPSYEKHYELFKALGVDEVYCLSVNDAFVMRKWGLDQGLEEDMTPGSLGFKKVKLIPDGACHFTRGMRMNCSWTSERGFGERSWRYSCYVVDGVIKKMFIEEPMIHNSEADPYQVSDAITMYNYLKQEKIKQLTEQVSEIEL